ncbi:hypothetical protein BDZ45DRAFT_258901 [Acephala macrosclerotiorum]|nr:hypothetical protein BDZ45DRAFT_258901 [Acephala macrosclerotiorum]
MIPDTFNHDAPGNTPSDGTMFTLFNRLPVELRLKIWEAALPGPRVVNIREKRLKKPRQPEREHIEETSPDFDLPTFSRYNPVGLTSDSEAPSLLFTCRESYNVASKFYVLSFTQATSIPETYFDFHKDTLYLRYDTFTLLERDDAFLGDWLDDWFDDFIGELECTHDSYNLRRVQNLALLLEPSRHTDCHGILAFILGIFGNVRKLTLVVRHFDQEEDGQGDIQFIEPINVTETCHNYETFSTKPSQNQDVLEVPLDANFVSAVDLERCLEETRQFLNEGGEDGDLVELPLPQVEYKSAVTGALKKYLDYLRDRHQQKITEG